MDARFEQLRRYFTELYFGNVYDIRSQTLTKGTAPDVHWRRTDKGDYVPSNLDFLYERMEALRQSGALDVNGIFVDYGSGHFCVPLLMSCVFGMEAVGIEFDDKLVEASTKY